jgi:hypothetical protein
MTNIGEDYRSRTLRLAVHDLGKLLAAWLLASKAESEYLRGAAAHHVVRDGSGLHTGGWLPRFRSNGSSQRALKRMCSNASRTARHVAREQRCANAIFVERACIARVGSAPAGHAQKRK